MNRCERRLVCRTDGTVMWSFLNFYFNLFTFEILLFLLLLLLLYYFLFVIAFFCFRLLSVSPKTICDKVRNCKTYLMKSAMNSVDSVMGTNVSNFDPWIVQFVSAVSETVWVFQNKFSRSWTVLKCLKMQLFLTPAQRSNLEMKS